MIRQLRFAIMPLVALAALMVVVAVVRICLDAWMPTSREFLPPVTAAVWGYLLSGAGVLVVYILLMRPILRKHPADDQGPNAAQPEQAK